MRHGLGVKFFDKEDYEPMKRLLMTVIEQRCVGYTGLKFDLIEPGIGYFLIASFDTEQAVDIEKDKLIQAQTLLNPNK